MKNNNKFSVFLAILLMAILTVIEFGLVSLLRNWLLYFIVILIINAVILAFVLYSFHSFQINRLSLIDEINGQAENSLQSTLEVLPVGIIRFEADSFALSWYNKYTEYIFDVSGETLTSEVIEDLVRNFADGKAFKLADKVYSVTLDKKNCIIYLQDITFEDEIQKDLANRRPIIGAIAIDNYDDLTDSMSEGNRSGINSFIANFLEKFADSKQIYLRRQNADRYVFFANYQVLSDLMQERFAGLLDNFRDQAMAQELPMTLSIGISYGIVDFAAIGRTALNNLDLALIRGGDQVVVKENENQAKTLYFGGNSESRVEKSRTRVRAISAMLNTIVSETNRVFIVGHRYMDMDSLGAAVMMRTFASSIGKEAFIVYDHEQLQDDTQKAIDKLNEEGDELYEHLVRLETAKKMRLSDSLLIMVDHSKLGQTLDIDFYNQFEKVVVIDHHRRDDDFPKNPLLTYIESGASSATEMAVEILQFQTGVKKRITKAEASVALAGISVDTKSFTKATTAKTFEAASYLRDSGADNVMVQYILATNFDEFKKVNEVVLQAEVLPNGVAVAEGKEDQTYDKVTLAKAADELLTLDNINASFVIALDKKKNVSISARSNGQKNVQTVMEQMGGGGHFDMAATQMENQTIANAKAELLQILNEDYK